MSSARISSRSASDTVPLLSRSMQMPLMRGSAAASWMACTASSNVLGMVISMRFTSMVPIRLSGEFTIPVRKSIRSTAPSGTAGCDGRSEAVSPAKKPKVTITISTVPTTNASRAAPKVLKKFFM